MRFPILWSSLPVNYLFELGLKNGDIILAHDYAFDDTTFQSKIKGKYWNWHEISESDILASVEKHNLKPYMQEIFEKAVWVCKIK